MAIVHSPLTVAEIHRRGRALVASRSIQAGEIILQDSPILLYPNPSSTTAVSPSFCCHCFRSTPSSSSSSLTCPSCSSVRFCSQVCLSAALSSSHSPWVCRTLSALSSSLASSLNSDLQTQAHFLIAAYNLSLVSSSNFSLLLSLHGASPPGEDSVFLHSLISSVSPEFASFSPELVAALLAKDKQNAFGLMEPFAGTGGRAVRAYGIYPRASFFNHDCLPNACRFDYVDGSANVAAAGAGGNTDIIVRAIHDIVQGREVCLSYFPVNWGYKDRQRRLMEDYGFSCDCDRCQVERNWKDEDEGGEQADEDMDEDDDDEDMEGSQDGEYDGQGDVDFPHAYFFVRYLCDRENCGGTLAPFPPSDGRVLNIMECNVCGKLREEENVGEEENSAAGVMSDL